MISFRTCYFSVIQFLKSGCLPCNPLNITCINVMNIMSDNRMNCWEFKQCGREPGGRNVEKYGRCSVPVSVEHNGMNNGKNGGRSCWILREAACEKIMRACRVDEIKECRQCRFHIHVKKSECSGRFFHKLIQNKAHMYGRSILMSLYKVTSLYYER